MDILLTELQKLTKSAKILQPDQTLQNYLIPLREYLSKSDSSNINSEKLKEIETILLQLLKINKGNLGVSCSIEIGRNLYHIYKQDPNKHFWNLISEVTSNPTESNIYAIKYVISKLGMFNKSALNQVAQLLLTKKKQNLHYPSLLAIKSLFKVCPHSFPKLVNQAFNFAKANSLNKHERVQIASIHLLQVLISEPEISVKKVLLIAQQVLSENHSKFVTFAVSNLISQCAVNPFLNEISERSKNEDQQTIPNQIREFQIDRIPKDHILSKSFEILLMFKSHFSQIFGLFLDKIPPEVIYSNVELLFNFVIQNSIKDVNQLTAFFGSDVHSLFFTAVKNQKNVNFSLLCGLVFDNNSAKEAAGVAHDKIWSQNPNERKEAIKFFASLSKIYPNAALESLHVALHYIAMPPDDSPTMMMEYSGQATIASILLASMPGKTESELPLLKKYVKFTLSENCENAFFLGSLFMILNTQNDEFASEYNLQEILDRIDNLYTSKIPSDFTNYPIKLIENILIFYASHRNYKNIQKFAEFCFQIADHLSNAALLSLIQIFHHLSVTESFAYSMATFLLSKSFTLDLSLKHIKKRVPELMKIPDELFFKEPKKQKEKNEIAHLLYFPENSLLNSKIIDFIPALIKKMNVKSAKSIINSAIQATNCISGHMIILSILQEIELDPSIADKIPNDIHISLTKAIINDKDEIKLQITSECIATYIKFHPNELSSLFPYLESKSKSIIPCFIETALSRIVKMNEDNLAYIIVQASNRLKKESLAIYVLHELSTIYAVKSLQLMNMMVGEQQCQQIVSLVTGRDIPVFTMYYASLSFEKLIPILLPTLHEKPTMNMILVFLNELWNSSIKFYKKIFYDLFTALFAFSKDVANYFILKPPRRSMMLDAQISACGAIADLEKAKPFESSILDQLPPFFVLLQRTRDKRVSIFLLSAVDSFCCKPVDVDELQNWFNLTHQLLSANSMVGFGDAIVEPNTYVKQTALSILKMLMQPLSKTKPFLVDCLDDVMASSLRSIESKNSELFKTSYEILEESLKLFKSFKTDQNVKLLSLYETQYISAIRSAFPSSLDVAYSFISEYIDFAFDQYNASANGKEACNQLITLLLNYLNRMKESEKMINGHFAIVTKIAVISEKYNEIFESICKEFLKKQVPRFRSLMVQSIELGSMSRTDEWQTITDFRQRISPFYSNFLSSFIWLQKIFPSNNDDCSQLKIKSLIDFFVSEASAAEKWRTCASFAAMSSIINYFGNEIESNDFELILKTCSQIFKSNQINVLPMMPKFLLCITRRASSMNLDIWPQLISLALSSECFPETIGILLKHSNDELLNQKDNSNSILIIKILDFVLKEFKSGIVNEEEAIAIITVMYFKCPNLIHSIVDRFFESNELVNNHPNFILTMIERASNHLSSTGSLCDDSTVLKIAEFLRNELKNKNNEALRIIAVISIRIPTTGEAILNNGCKDEIIDNFDGLDPLSLLYCFDLILSKFDHSQKVAEKIAEVAEILILNHGSERDLKIVSKAVGIIRKCSSLTDSALAASFDSLNENRRNELLRILQKYSKKKIVKKISLKKFTVNSSYKRNNQNEGVWQNLDEDSD